MSKWAAHGLNCVNQQVPILSDSDISIRINIGQLCGSLLFFSGYSSTSLGKIHAPYTKIKNIWTGIGHENSVGLWARDSTIRESVMGIGLITWSFVMSSGGKAGYYPASWYLGWHKILGLRRNNMFWKKWKVITSDKLAQFITFSCIILKHRQC